MTDLTDLSPMLERRLDGLMPVPPEHFLAAGRAATTRRRRRRGAGLLGIAAAGVLLATQVLPSGSDAGVAREHRPAIASADGAVEPPSLSSLTVQAGVGDIDAYTTDEIPSWATEYGNHGPAAIGPDGRLWIAPDASVVRSIDGLFGDAPGIAHSYAIEVEWTPHDADQGGTGLYWWWSSQASGSTDSGGLMDDADRWTTDFALWAQDNSGYVVNRPSFSRSLVRFADDTSKVLTAQPGVTILDQTTDVDTGDMEHYARRSAAVVAVDGHTYFVLANGRASGHAFYEPYEAAVVGPDLPSFLAFVARGFVPQGSTP